MGFLIIFAAMILAVLFFFLTPVTPLNLTQFDTYEINFDANCVQYLYYQGETDYVYFYQNKKNDQFELWISQNTSNYEIYTLPWQDGLVFRWPDLAINDVKMNLKLYEGVINYPLVLETETFLCEVSGITGGSFPNSEPILDVYKCQSSDKWKLSIAGVFLFIVISPILVLIVTKYGSCTFVLRPDVPGCLLRCRKLLPRGSQDIPPTEEERRHSVPKSTGSVHFTQENTKTSKV